MTSAFGKAILLGEHAVVYGHPALAGAIDAMVRCAWRPIDAPERTYGHDTVLRVQAPAWDLDLEIESGAEFTDESLGDPERAVAALVHGLDVHLGVDVLAALGPGEIVLDTRLPAAAGLGSSASMAVAVTRALSEAMGRQLTNEEIATLAHCAERCFHANPSGVDVALAANGGLGLYYRGRGLEPVDAPPLRLAVGLTGVPRSTAVMVSRVAAAWEAERARVDDDLATLGAAALAGAEAMRQGDVARLGKLMDGAHQILAGLGVSSVEINRLCDIARSAGALGAKLTGAGGGGAVIALGNGSNEAEENIVAAWRAAGHDGFVCRVGVTS